MGVLNTTPVRSSQEDEYFIDQAFTTRVDAGTVTVEGRDWGSDLAVARTGNGVYTLTFTAAKKPTKARCFVNVAENSAVYGKGVYNASTGVVTVYLFTAAGAADNTASLTVEVLLLCSKSRSAG